MVPISGCVIVTVIVAAVVEAITPISVETSMAMIAPTAVDTLEPTEWADACVYCACEEDCDDYDDIEVSVLADLVIIFKV